MSSKDEINQQVARESEWRARLAVPAFAGGLLYLLSGIVTNAVASSAPTVGVLQGLAPALSGEANPAVSPRAPEVKYLSHHASSLIIASVLAAIAIGALTLVLMLLADASRFRRPASWALARPLVLVGGVALAVISVVHQVVLAIETHSFAVGHDFTNNAVDNALAKSTPNVVSQYLDLLAGLAVAVAMGVIVVNAIRVGLVTRWLGVVGIISAILIFLPIGGATLEVIPSFWLVAIGILYIGKWPNGQPPAWESGEARPWPSRAQMREQTGGARGGRPALATGSGDVAPAPAKPAAGGSSRKRRKRGARDGDGTR
ncbi:MAG TPA: hypothetical protein VK707_00485 [Solirubrobacteraceae bacterium]|jgi:hypothetical protein|nr:hypothetical protein [Solirubrobacteraceae bacterium]